VRARLRTDGGSRGNPGPSAFGYVIEGEDGTILEARGEAIGEATNNIAEYRALLGGVRAAIDLGVTELEVLADSKLVVMQMRGEWKIKNDGLRELSIEAARLARQLGTVEYRHVPRAENKLADKLVNEALDAA